jgi:hypothetical protein
MAVVLDAGGLIAIDKRDRRVGAILRVSQLRAIPVRTSAAVVAQVWRAGARQANLARTLTGVEIATIDYAAGRRIGALLARSGTADVVDAHVGLLADVGDTVLTSDGVDIKRLLETRNVAASIDVT